MKRRRRRQISIQIALGPKLLSSATKRVRAEIPASLHHRRNFTLSRYDNGPAIAILGTVNPIIQTEDRIRDAVILVNVCRARIQDLANTRLVVTRHILEVEDAANFIGRVASLKAAF